MVCLACFGIAPPASRTTHAGDVTAAALPAQDPILNPEAVLRAAGQYLLQYEKAVSGIDAEEDYVQRMQSGMETRRLRSDMLLILEPNTGWVGFRDVFEVNGQGVRDRDQRLANLFIRPNPNAIAQAQRIVAEGARFNLNPPGGGISRTINQPFMALKFLRAADQPRSAFTIDRAPGSRSEILITFVEKAKPRLIRSPDGAAAHGSFQVDPSSGRVTASELVILTGATKATIRVSYAEQSALNLWLPASMDESYTSASLRIEGHAIYTKFQQFKVETDDREITAVALKPFPVDLPADAGGQGGPSRNGDPAEAGPRVRSLRNA
ncbi:MAG: hypothetical protein ABJC89_21435 [Acidobacteriota bacterium]